MNKINTVVINLTGGPGCGKSTTAAGLFYELKKRGYNCELVTEYAKDKVWENSFDVLEDQIYILGKQFHKMWRLNGKVQYIITDTCLPLTIHYNKMELKHLNDLVVELYNKFNNQMFFIERGATYQQEGRMQNLEESKKIDDNIKLINTKYHINYIKIKQETAIQDILRYLKID